jgi:peptide-methionine (S)-S-oxide reductase
MKTILTITLLFTGLLLGGTNTMAQETPSNKENTQKAIVAAGCFWCIEPTFDAMDGVIETVVGYTGGHTEKPTYKEIGTGTTGHTEAILIVYDASKVTYEEILGQFWLNVDPFDGGGQFVDRGPQYRPAIFYVNDEQRKLAEKTAKQVEEEKGKKVEVEITEASTFWPAEDYHQEYYEKNPLRYKFYKAGSGRDNRLDEVWGEQPSNK